MNYSLIPKLGRQISKVYAIINVYVLRGLKIYTNHKNKTHKNYKNAHTKPVKIVVVNVVLKSAVLLGLSLLNNLGQTPQIVRFSNHIGSTNLNTMRTNSLELDYYYLNEFLCQSNPISFYDKEYIDIYSIYIIYDNRQRTFIH